MRELLTEIASPDRTATRPSEAPVSPSSATVIRLPSAAVRELNLRAFTELTQHVHAIHGDLPDTQAIQDQAAKSVRRFPVPVLGPGLRRTLGEMQGGPAAYRFVLSVLIDADRRLLRGTCINTADAFVRAFAAFRSETLAETRRHLIQASRDCEFFAPELVLLLLDLWYD